MIFGISANTNKFIRQRGEPWQAQVPIPPLKQTNRQKRANVIKDGPLPLGMNEVERQML